MIPYGRQSIDEKDISAVDSVLCSDWLTTGPKVTKFEESFAGYTGASYAVAVSSGTAALHCAVHAAGVGPGDEVILPPITFAATANAVLYQGGIPVFADIDSGTLLIDPKQVEKKITEKTKAIIAVDYAGQTCNYNRLKSIAKANRIKLIADACHSLGAEYRGKKVGSLADLTVFSFHPVKHITTGEGGMITTDNADDDRHMRIFRNHGITTDSHQREKRRSWHYEMVDLGFNYRLTDIQCALGLSQLEKLPGFLCRRRIIAGWYDSFFNKIHGITPLTVIDKINHAYHLYVVKIDASVFPVDRSVFFDKMRSKNIGVNVHYIPVHLHPYYKKNLGTKSGLCPVVEKEYEKIVSLPIFPSMTEKEFEQVRDAINEIIWRQ